MVNSIAVFANAQQSPRPLAGAGLPAIAATRLKLSHRVVCIAGKPAPTRDIALRGHQAWAGGASLLSLILYQATYNAGRNNRVSKVAEMMPPIMA